MTCPNAFPGVDGQCAGRGWIVHRSQPVPCPSCWRVAGNPPLAQRQTAQLRRYHVLLTVLDGQTTLFDSDEVCSQFDNSWGMR